jgi:hypothetical protein
MELQKFSVCENNEIAEWNGNGTTAGNAYSKSTTLQTTIQTTIYCYGERAPGVDSNDKREARKRYPFPPQQAVRKRDPTLQRGPRPSQVSRGQTRTSIQCQPALFNNGYAGNNTSRAAFIVKRREQIWFKVVDSCL